MSAAGYNLKQIKYHGTKINLRTRTISVCYDPCQYPQNYRQLCKLKENDILIGPGAYCEEGRRRVKVYYYKEQSILCHFNLTLRKSLVFHLL